jgi:hypothetical protein
MDRREFVRSSFVLTSGIVVADSLLAGVNPSIIEAPPGDLYKEFQDPPAEARLFVRWWWNGNRLDKKEILRELDVMKEAGIGGVEINPIAFPPDTDPLAYESLKIFEEQWLEMLQVALKGAKERGMICDMIVGSGWPFGGEFLAKEDQTQMVTIETIQLEGGTSYTFTMEELLARVDPEIHSKNPVVYRDLLMVRLLPEESLEFTEGEDLMGHIRNDELSLAVPEGQWVLYYVVKLTGYMAVINGSPGAAGPVLNHYSKSATETYLNRISDILSGKVGRLGDYIRAMFCDSMELEGANWNDDLPEEFESRRGYALLPYLPFVLKKVGHMGNPLEEAYGTRFSEELSQRIKRVELDFYLTRIELFKERFIDTFNDWCHTHKLQSRMQAYGRGLHPLEASMEIDIPDCETWLFKDVGRAYPNLGLLGRAPRMSNKYVSSAACLAGKKLVACEEITNTSMAFMASLENIKVAGDQSNLSGVNHSILHGFNYSPPEAPFPGWVRYGSYFSDRNSWWPYFRKWSDYKARISYLLQQASPRADVAILQPLTDLWLKYGPQRDPFPGKWYPEYQNNLWEVIHQNGGGCDYVSESVIAKSTFQKGNMNYKRRSYHTLLLPEIETLDLATAHKLIDFAHAGGRIVFIGKRPLKSDSYKEMAVNDTLVNSLMDELVNQGSDRIFEVSAPEGSLLDWYAELREKLGMGTYVKFNKTHPHLNQSSYLLGDSYLFFLANSSLHEDLFFDAEFIVDERLIPWVWEPDTGEKYMNQTRTVNNFLKISLPRASSLILIFESELEGEVYRPMIPNPYGEEVRGSWILDLEPMFGSSWQMELDELADLSSLDRSRNFAGRVTYRKTIFTNMKRPDQLDLGDVQGISELYLNGHLLGTKWYVAHLYDLRKAWKEGENLLVIHLTIICGNYMKGLKDNKVAQRWVGHQEYYPMGIMGPVRLSMLGESNM